MAEVNAWLMGDHGKTAYAVAQERRLAAEENMSGIPAISPGTMNVLTRRPERYLYLYNISSREFTVSNPQLYPNLRIKACPEGQKFACVGKFGDPFISRWENENRRLLTDEEPAARVLTDMLNSSNHSNQCFGPISDTQMEQVSDGTNDLTRRGVFWSEHNPPLESEVNTARQRMESHYRALIRDANILSRNPKTMGEIGPEHHIAADYFRNSGTRFDWHGGPDLPDICENCGTNLPREAGFHPIGNGQWCIRDWRKAVNAGIVKMRDVPEEKRWNLLEDQQPEAPAQ